MDEFEGQRTYAGNPPSQSDELRVQRSLWQRLNKKALSVILFLNIIGSILILVGVIVQGGKGVEYFILGSICVLPGGYALYHIYKACRATNIDDRDRHLEYVPE